MFGLQPPRHTSTLLPSEVRRSLRNVDYPPIPDTKLRGLKETGYRCRVHPRFTATRGYRRTVRASPLRRRRCGSTGRAKVFREVASGAKSKRTQLRRLLDQFDAVDVMMVTRLDRQRAAPR